MAGGTVGGPTGMRTAVFLSGSTRMAYTSANGARRTSSTARECARERRGGGRLLRPGRGQGPRGEAQRGPHEGLAPQEPGLRAVQ